MSEYCTPVGTANARTTFSPARASEKGVKARNAVNAAHMLEYFRIALSLPDKAEISRGNAVRMPLFFLLLAIFARSCN
jgi:hypothetical protein